MRGYGQTQAAEVPQRLLRGADTKPMEPMAGVIYGTEETLEGCHQMMTQIEAILTGAGPEQPKEPVRAVTPLIECAFNVRTKTQMMHKRISDLLAVIGGR